MVSGGRLQLARKLVTSGQFAVVWFDHTMVVTMVVVPLKTGMVLGLMLTLLCVAAQCGTIVAPMVP